MPDNLFPLYKQTLGKDFTKLAKLDFLNPDGTVAFAVDNNAMNKYSSAFLQQGTFTCNLNNGRRRQATVVLDNASGKFEYDINRLWFGQEIKLSEGLLLPDGQEMYFPQGIFRIETPSEERRPADKLVTLNLVDKWAALDGTLSGNLEGAYSVPQGTNIFSAMASLLKLDRYTMASNGAHPIDLSTPLFTNYYNGKTQTLSNGQTVNLIDTPYEFISNDSGTLADVILGLAEMLAALVGYNALGRLVIDPSQDDILDTSKPVEWTFMEGDKALLSPTMYTSKPSEVYNDLIVVGDTSDTAKTASGRAQNHDPSSDTCISRIGLKTKRIIMQNYYSDDICRAYADWQLKRQAILSKVVDIKCTQMFHIRENGIIAIQRSDKPGSPIERHLIQGFSRPIAQKGAMTINAVSVNDFPVTTIV